MVGGRRTTSVRVAFFIFSVSWFGREMQYTELLHNSQQNHMDVSAAFLFWADCHAPNTAGVCFHNIIITAQRVVPVFPWWLPFGLNIVAERRN